MKSNPGSLAKALYSNTPEAKNELLFRKGDILTVIEYDYDGQPGWWLCSHRGQRGICPSNYLQLLEDNYSYVDHNRQPLEESLSHSGAECESALQKGEGKVGQDFDPLETYDVPRSCLAKSSSSEPPLDDPVSYSNQPLYQNADQPSPEITNESSPLELYDVPRSFQAPIYGQSLSRLRRYGQTSENSLLVPRTNNIQNWKSACGRSVSSSDLGLPPSGTRKGNNIRSSPINSKSNLSTESSTQSSSSTPISQTIPVILRRNSHHRLQNHSTNNPINQSNRSSIRPESAESGIVMISSPPSDLYDVPRSAVPVRDSTPANNNGNCGAGSSRPQSSLSISSSGMGLSIANSDSKDSLDLYDVPRSAKSYVNHMETKYDQVQSRLGNSSSSLSRDSSTIPSHSRHNSTSSIFSAYGYSHQGFMDVKRPSLGSVSNFGSRSSIASRSSVDTQNYPANDLYDVPRSSNCIPPPNPRTNKIIGASSSNSVASSRSQASLVSESESAYDVPASFARKVSLCDSTETLSYKSDGGESRLEMKLGTSSSNLSSSPKLVSGGGHCSEEVKIIPLSAKAAISVCEKLRHEVVTSISSILEQVKPKWRSKENLTTIMPDLRFSCVRLSLAIKDIAEFATRSLSNAKKVGDELLVTKLHRLLTPVMNGSQIVQRDVDELEAYFWSVNRLSISPGGQNEKNASGDALDQLILCARSLKHDVTEIANFLALNSSTLFREHDVAVSVKSLNQMFQAEAKVEDTQEDYDYVSLMSSSEAEINVVPSSSSKPISSISGPPPSQLQLDSRDQQLLEFYSGQIGVTAPLLSQSISTFISAIHQNEPPEVFNLHVKYVILFAYKMLFAGDTVHRNVNNVQLKMEIESKANDLHKSILALYEASKVATLEFPKISPMQSIVDKVWSTTQAATQLKKIIFNATCVSI